MKPSPAKYLFDHDFAAASRGNPSISLTDHAAKVREAEAAAYRSGFAAAQAEGNADVARRSAGAFERIAAALDEFKGKLEAAEAKLEGEAVEVAVAVGKKLAADLIAREPFAEISALAANCFRQLVAAPHVVVRVNDALQAEARAKLDELAHARGLETRLVVLAEPNIPPGDCRIEWADGGITRNRATIAAEIDQAVSRYIGARLTTTAT